MEGPELVLGSFELRGELGRGAMAVVWRAYDTSLDREVAIKEPSLPPGGDVEVREEFARRFVREARAAARLNHRGIVTIHSASLDEGRPLIVMELVEGPTLRQVLDTQRLTPSQTYALLEQLLEATAFAHEHGVIHRDLKPDNVFVTPGGTVKLADFGIAHLGDAGTTLTMAGTLLGTPAYMAPEQIRGEPVDARCDLFALGVIAYECLAGENPFGSSTTSNYVAMFHRILDEPAPPLELADPAAAALADVAIRALEKDREARFSDAAEMLAAWRAAFPSGVDGKVVMGQVVTAVLATQPVPDQPVNRRHRRTRLVLLALVLSILAAVLLSAGWSFTRDRERQPAGPAPWRLVTDYSLFMEVKDAAFSNDYGSTGMAVVVGLANRLNSVTFDGRFFTEGVGGDAPTFYGVDADSTGAMWAAGERGSIYVSEPVAWNGSIDYGPWRRMYSAGRVNLHGIAALLPPDADDASQQWIFAVGEDGTVVNSLDGGHHWHRTKVPSGRDPSSIRDSLWGVCPDQRPGSASDLVMWAVGQQGTVLRSGDRGLTWTAAQHYATTETLFAVTFWDEAHGWIVGRRGTILATTDHGKNWHLQESLTRNDLADVCFIDAKTGWAVGAGGTILFTRNGGILWQKQRTNTGSLRDFVALASGFGSVYAFTREGFAFELVRSPT